MCSNPLSCVFIHMLSASLNLSARSAGRLKEGYQKFDDYIIKHDSPLCCVVIYSLKSWESSLQTQISPAAQQVSVQQGFTLGGDCCCLLLFPECCSRKARGINSGASGFNTYVFLSSKASSWALICSNVIPCRL